MPLGPGSGIMVHAEAEASLDFWAGLFESEIAPYVRRFCRPGIRCIDVGGYNAYYALVFAKLCDAPVISYEPDPVALQRCRRNLILNPQLARWVDLRQAMVGAAHADNLVTLDDDLPDAPVGMVKIDVDGGEVDVLAGAIRTLTLHRPSVIVETHWPTLEQACGDLLVQAGYAPRVVTQRRLLPQHRYPHNRWLVAEGQAL